MDEKSFKELILNNNYIEWLSSIIEKYEDINDKDFLFEDTTSKVYIECLKYLFLELNKYVVKYNINCNGLDYYLKYNDNLYHIYYDGCYCLKKANLNDSDSFVDYKEFINEFKKNMEYNFDNLKERTVYSLYNSDLEKLNFLLSHIDDSTLVSGVGGSSVVSEFATKILSRKNNIITRNTEHRDFRYLDISLYKNVLMCSYSGNNYGVELSFLNNLKHYLLASKENNKDDIINLTYNCKDIERSFISLAATLIPCSILLNYYLDNDIENIIDCIDSYNFDFDVNCDIFEIFSGYDTSVVSKYLESTMVESGIGIPIVHDKYAYCHGRSTLSTNYNNIAIYLDSGTELDKLLLNELYKYYKDIVVIKVDNNFLGEYRALIECIYLTKYIAEKRNMDLSGVDYNPIVKKLYKYKGDL